jgi:signal transduction histidine kinase
MTHSRLSLLELHQVLLVAVATSGLRHNLRNKLGSLRNATFFLKRKLDGQAVWRDDVRVPRFFDIMESELAAADQIMGSGMSEVLSEPQPEPVDLGAVVRAALEMRPAPAGARVASEVEPGEHRLATSNDELVVALRCLLDNAIESVQASGGGAVIVRSGRTDEGFVSLEVTDDGGGFADGDPAPWLAPFATTKPGRLGLGISVARRVASRAGGTLEVTAADRGARAAIAVPLDRRSGDGDGEAANPPGR